MAGMAVFFNVAGCLIEERRRWPVRLSGQTMNVNDRNNIFFDEFTIAEWFQSFPYQCNDSKNVPRQYTPIQHYSPLAKVTTLQS